MHDLFQFVETSPWWTLIYIVVIGSTLVGIVKAFKQGN